MTTTPFTWILAYAAQTQFGECIAHGMLTGAFISAAIAMELPGPGTIYLGQQISFRAPVLLGDTLTVDLEIVSKHESKPWLTINCIVSNQSRKESGHRRGISDGAKQQRNRHYRAPTGHSASGLIGCELSGVHVDQMKGDKGLFATGYNAQQ